MSDVKHQVSVVIGAALSGGFSEAISTSKTEFLALGNVIKELESSSLGISDKFDNLRRKTLEAKREWYNSEAEVKRLADQMAETKEPTAAMTKAFEKSKAAADKAKKAYIGKRDALQELSEQIRSSGIDMANLSANQTQLGASLEKLKKQYGELGAIMSQKEAVKAQQANYRSQMMGAIALSATLGAPIKSAVEFETAMAEVNKVVHFPNAEELEKMGNTLLQMTREIPLSLKNIAHITKAGAQMGIPVEDLEYFTKAVAEMSTCYEMTTSEAGSTMAKLSNVFQIPITKLGNFGDAINHLGNKTAATAREIVLALSRMGGAVIQFGLTTPQAAALGATLVSLQISSQKAGTVVSAMLNRLMTVTRNGPAARAAFEKLGLTVVEMKKAIAENPQGALMNFLERVKEKVKEADRPGILQDIFGKHYQLYVAQLVESLQTYKKALKLVENPENYKDSIAQEFERRSATVANRTQLLKNSLNEISISIGVTLLPAISDLVTILRGATCAIADFAEAHPEVIKYITLATAALISCKVASVALGYAWTFVKGGALAISAAVKGAQIAFTLFETRLLATGTVIPTITTAFRALIAVVAANPIGAAITALAVGATLIIANWEKVKAFFTTIWDSIKPIWKKFSNFAAGIFDKITSPFATIKSSIGSLFSSSENQKSPDIKKFPQTSKTNDSTTPASKKSLIGSLFSSSDEKQKTEPLKLPQISKTNVSKSQNNSFNITVNATPDQNPTSIANSVSEKMKEFSGAFLYDSIGEVP